MVSNIAYMVLHIPSLNAWKHNETLLPWQMPVAYDGI